MEFEAFSILTTPVIIVDMSGQIVYANAACETPFEMSVRRIKKCKFPDFLNGETTVSIEFDKVTEPTRYNEIAYKTQTSIGSIFYALQPIKGKNDESLVMVAFHNDTVEQSLMKKYRSVRATSESLAAEVYVNQADLLISRDSLERKISETSFLLKFYSQARFVLDLTTISQQFLKLTTDHVGFLFGMYFSISSTDDTNATIMSMTERRYNGSENFIPDTAREVMNIDKIPILSTNQSVIVYSQAQLKDCGADKFYSSLGLTKVFNAAVMNINAGEKKTGQFHFINYMHSEKVDSHTVDLLNYMVDPLSLTFQNAEFYRTSITDELTQLNNIRYFRSRLESEVQEAKRNGTAFSIIMLDIDRFKGINDKYGHPIGDLAIKAVADQLRVSIRPSDIVARYGGEEFIVILPGADEKVATAVAERVRSKIGQITIPTDKGDLKFTASAGISFFPNHATSSGEIIEKADLALYVAKNTGRDRTVIFNDEKRAAA